jgi:hypothetical protein
LAKTNNKSWQKKKEKIYSVCSQGKSHPRLNAVNQVN